MSEKKSRMDITTIIIVVIIGVASGLLGGMVGVGGGLIIVPALVYFLGFSQHTAQGTSLGLILLPVGILGVIQYYKQGHVDFKVVGLLAIGFLIGSYFGSKFSLSLPQSTVKKFFAALMFIMAIKIYFDSNNKAEKTVEKTSSMDIKK